MFRREIIQAIKIEGHRFGFETEITSKIDQGNPRIYEIGISYYGRTYPKGKNWMEGRISGDLRYLESVNPFIPIVNIIL